MQAKKTTINPFLRNFFFLGIKRKKEYKDVVKESGGKVTDVTIIIVGEKTVLRIVSPTKGNIDKPFTREEMVNFCKGLNIKMEDVDNSKHIIISFDMNKKTIFFDREKKDGTKILMDI